jgi:integration host factor subunit beta
VKIKRKTKKYVALIVKTILDTMSSTISKGGRIEIQGLGSFSLNYRPQRNGRNPKTGETVLIHAKYSPRKHGRQFMAWINQSFAEKNMNDGLNKLLP